MAIGFLNLPSLNITGIFGTFVNILIYGAIFLVIIGLILYFGYIRRRWNLKVEFKLPRSNVKLARSEWGKGMYSTKRGVVWLKRKGKRKVKMQPFDIKRFIQEPDTLTVIQLGAEHYVPVLPESYINWIDDVTHDEAVELELHIEPTKANAWANAFEREAKLAYNIMNILERYSTFIGIGLVLFMQLIGFSILYGKIS